MHVPVFCKARVLQGLRFLRPVTHTAWCCVVLGQTFTYVLVVVGVLVVGHPRVNVSHVSSPHTCEVVVGRYRCYVLRCLQKYGVDLLCDRPLPADRVEGGSSAFGVRRLAGDASFLSLVEAAGHRMFPGDDGVVLDVSRVRALCPKSVGRAAVCQTCLHFQKA